MVVGRVEVGDIHLQAHQAHHLVRRARPRGALVAHLDHQEAPNLEAAVAPGVVAAQVAPVEPQGDWSRT